MARIAVDIDGVIASKLESGNYPEDYVKKEPIAMAVSSLEKLKEKGHTVFLFTARWEDDRQVTEEWLETHGFKGLYEALVMGKPHYDVLIDDRALRFEDWNNALYQLEVFDKKGQWY
jgi:uncharacterized HAD superfamily protein